jgi:hypothetical protein
VSRFRRYNRQTCCLEFSQPLQSIGDVAAVSPLRCQQNELDVISNITKSRPPLYCSSCYYVFIRPITPHNLLSSPLCKTSSEQFTAKSP